MNLLRRDAITCYPTGSITCLCYAACSRIRWFVWHGISYFEFVKNLDRPKQTNHAT